MAHLALLDDYSKLEIDKTNIQVASAISLLNEQASQLSTGVRNNAHWDDLYQYLVKQNPALVK